MQERPVFVIISIAAKVGDRPLMFHKWGVVKGCTCNAVLTKTRTPRWKFQH